MRRSSRLNSLLLLAKRTCLRWKIGALVFAVCFSLVVAFALLLPSTYRSRMNVVIGQVRPIPGAPHAAGIAGINSEIQRLTSDDLLRKVVVQSHLVVSAGTAGVASRQQEEAAVRRLQENLAVTAFRGPDVVEVTYQSTSPERAAEVLRTMAGAYVNTYRVTPVVSASTTRLEKMATTNHARLSAARSELARFVKAHRVAQTPTSLDEAGVQLTEAEDATQRALLRRVTDLQSLDQSFRTHIAEARLVERLDAQAISRVGSMEPSPPQLVSAPPRAFLGLCGFLASLLLGVCSALTAELLSDRLDTKSSVEEATGIPVLASIPPGAVAPAFQNAFPALYLAMQRPVNAFEGKLS